MRRILVPLDGSAFAESAIPHALGVMQRTGAVLEALAVHVPPPASARDPAEAAVDRRRNTEERDELLRYLDDLSRRLHAAHEGIALECTLRDGAAAPTIAEHVATSGAELVVLTSHGRGGINRLWIGSVTDHLLRRLTIPLLVIQPNATPQRDFAPVPIGEIVVPIDETPASEEGIEAALAIAGTEGVRYTLLHVTPPPPRAARMVTTAEEYERKAEEHRLRVEAALDAVAGRLRERGMASRAVTTLGVSPQNEIVRYVEQHGADLVSLATHGHGHLGRFLLGSVADKVVRTAPVPVLVRHAVTGDAD